MDLCSTFLKVYFHFGQYWSNIVDLFSIAKIATGNEGMRQNPIVTKLIVLKSHFFDPLAQGLLSGR